MPKNILKSNKDTLGNTDFSIRRIRRLIAIPVTVFAISFSIVLLIVISRQFSHTSQLVKRDIEQSISSQESMIISEIFLEQTSSTQKRMTIIQELLKSRYPESRVCFELAGPSNQTIFASCTARQKKMPPTGKIIFKIGDKLLGTLDFRVDTLPQWRQAFLKFIFISLMIASLLTAILIHFLGRRIEHKIVTPLLDNIRENERAMNKVEASQKLAKLATQVAHDIRSPLAALDSVVTMSLGLPEDVRVITRTAVSRIKDIANNLIQKNQQIQLAPGKDNPITDATPSNQLISALCESIISEKRIQYRHKMQIEIDFLI